MVARIRFHFVFWVNEYRRRFLFWIASHFSTTLNHQVLRQLEILGSAPQLDLKWRTNRVRSILTAVHDLAEAEMSVVPGQDHLLSEEQRWWSSEGIFELHDVTLDAYSGLVFSDGYVIVQSGYGHHWPCDAAFLTGATRRVRSRHHDLEARPIAMLGDVVHHYHFLIETLPRVLRLLKVCPEITFITTTQPIPMAQEILASVDASYRLVDEECTIEGTSVFIHEPTPRDFPRSSDLELLRETFTPVAHRLIPTSSDRVYVSRSRSARALANEGSLEDWLMSKNFSVLHLEDLPFLEQVGRLSHAKLVVAPHGAGLANTAFMAPGGSVIELSSGEWISPAFRRISAQCNHQYRFLELVGTDQAPWGDGLEAISLLKDFIDDAE